MVGGCAGSEPIASTRRWIDRVALPVGGSMRGDRDRGARALEESVCGEPIENGLDESGLRGSGEGSQRGGERTTSRRQRLPFLQGMRLVERIDVGDERGADRLEQPVSQQPLARLRDAGGRARERERVRCTDGASLVREDRGKVVTGRRGAPGKSVLRRGSGAPRRRRIQHRATPERLLAAGLAKDEAIEDVQHQRASRRDPDEGFLSRLETGADRRSGAWHRSPRRRRGP